jgi:ribonuclease P protein component
VGDDYFSVLGQNNQKPFARLGLAIARKHVKKAVSRNRVKRLVRESFRQHQQQLAGLDIIVMLRADASRLDNESIRQHLTKLWQSLITKCEKY